MHDVGILWDGGTIPTGTSSMHENDLSVEEVEDVLLDPDNEVLVSRTSGRPITFGWTSTGRHIAVIWETVIDEPRTTVYGPPTRSARNGEDHERDRADPRKTERTPEELAELKAKHERFSPSGRAPRS